jgi:hypothetical protein
MKLTNRGHIVLGVAVVVAIVLVMGLVGYVETLGYK